MTTTLAEPITGRNWRDHAACRNLPPAMFEMDRNDTTASWQHSRSAAAAQSSATATPSPLPKPPVTVTGVRSPAATTSDRSNTMTSENTWPFDVERYCVDSGRPVRMIPGDRCIEHGGAPTMCTTDVRPAQCTHPHLSPNHPTPHCSECGKAVQQ